MFELVSNPLGPQPDFDLTVDRLIASPVAGGSLNVGVSAIAKNGFNAPVALTVTRLNEAATAAFTPATLSLSGQTPYSSTMAISTAASIGPLYETVVISGTGGGRTRSAAFWLVIHDFALSATSASAAQGSSATSTVTVSGLYGFADPVALSVSGLPPGATASFAPGATADVEVLTVSLGNDTPTGLWTFSVIAAGGGLTHTASVLLTVTGPGFDLTAGPPSATIPRGGNASFSITISPHNGFNGSVHLRADGLPPGATASWSPVDTASSSTLTLSISTAATPGTYPISLSGTGTGAIGSAEISVAIVDPSPSTGCSSGGSTGSGGALLGVLVAIRLLRRRQGAQPCAALESSIVSE